MSQVVHTEPRRRKTTPASLSASSPCRTRALTGTIGSPGPQQAHEPGDVRSALHRRSRRWASANTRALYDMLHLLYIKVRSRVRSAQLREDIVQGSLSARDRFFKARTIGPSRSGSARSCAGSATTSLRNTSVKPVGISRRPGKGSAIPADETAGNEERLVTDERKRQVRRAAR